MAVSPISPTDVMHALTMHGYIADEGLATSVYLAMTLRRPLLLEGEAGVGKTEVAKVLSRWTGGELIRLQCYEGIDVSQAVYDWDYSRQLLHLRAAEATGESRGLSTDALEAQLYQEKFLLKRALLQAIDNRGDAPPVLLIDEIDRADDEFEAYLLEVLADYSDHRARARPFNCHPPPDRGAHLQPHPRRARRAQAPLPLPLGGAPRLRARGADRAPAGAPGARPPRPPGGAAVEELRTLNLYKPPGVAETIDWAQALCALGRSELDQHTVEATLGTVLKYREDQDRARQHGVGGLVRQAVERSYAPS